jgi:protein ImuB
MVQQYDVGNDSMSRPDELYACLYAKEFPAQAALRLRPELRDQPVVILEGEAPLQTVCSFNAKARYLGITRGMTRVELDTFPSVHVLLRSQSEESAAHAVMLECAGAFSPRVEDRSDRSEFLCVIDIAGTEKLLGAPRILARELLRRVRGLGVSATVAVSRNFHAAASRVRHSSQRISLIEPGNEGPDLASLPIKVLDMSREHAETFALWGIHTLGALATLPEKELVARIGQEGRRLRQLARGELPHHFVPHEAAFQLEERMELDSPVEELERLLFVVNVMLEQLALRATVRALALASVTITLSLEGESTHVRVVRPALPTNDRQLWIKLLHLDLESHPPKAAILALALSAEPGSTSKVQLGLFSPQLPEPMRLEVTLARLRSLVGDDCVGSPVLRDTNQLDAFRVQPFKIPSVDSSTFGTSSSPVAMRQLRPPERVSIALQDRRPASFIFRGCKYEVEYAYGPWLAEGDWWNLQTWALEQWDLIARSNDGAVLCCCLVRDLKEQAGSDVWQVVTLYD